MQQVFNLAHLTDFHLFQPRGAPWRGFLNKRLLSYLSWRLQRGKTNSPRVLSIVLDALPPLALDQVVVTGDLTHMGLPLECVRARRYLERIGSPDRVFVIPGNHDALVPSACETFPGVWGGYLDADNKDSDHSSGPEDYPAVRIRNGIALIGLSSACPTRPFSAAGRLGKSQCRRLASILYTTGRQQLFRIVLIHHPILAGQVKPRKRLRDAAALRATLHQHGAELVLHGHTHRHSHASLSGPIAPIPVLGLPSSTAKHAVPQKGACLRVYAIRSETGGWQIEVHDYRLPSQNRMRRLVQSEGLPAWRTPPNIAS